MQEDKDNKPPSSSSSLQAKKLNMATMKQLSLIREESLSFDTVDDAPSCYANPLLTPLVSGIKWINKQFLKEQEKCNN